MIIGLRISHRILEATVLQKFLDEWAKASLIGIHGVDNIHPRFVLATLLPTRDMVPESRCMPPLKPGLMNSEDVRYRFFGTTQLISDQLRIIKG